VTGYAGWYYIFYYTAIHYGHDKLKQLTFLGNVPANRRNSFYKVVQIPPQVTRGKNVL
jgi:hypothetical protein